MGIVGRPDKLKKHKKDIRELIRQGEHPRDIARLFGVHDTTMTKFCARNGLKYMSGGLGRYANKMVGGKKKMRIECSKECKIKDKDGNTVLAEDGTPRKAVMVMVSSKTLKCPVCGRIAKIAR